MAGVFGRRMRAAMVAAGAAAAIRRRRPAAVPIGDGVPEGQISIQLYSFNSYIGNDAGRLETVLAALKDAGYSAVEPYSFHGITAQQFRALLDEYDLRAVARHGGQNTGEIPNAKILGQEYVGSGGTAPSGIGSLAATLASADELDAWGKASVEAGTGKAYIHNHGGEFTTQYSYEGEMTSAWEILMQETDPRYVAAEIDVFWATQADADVPALLDEYGDRVEMLHIKDGLPPYDGNTQTAVGAGDIDWDPILAAAEDHVRWYHVELDPPGSYPAGEYNADDGLWRDFLEDSIDALRSEVDHPGIRAYPSIFPTQAGATISGSQAVVVKNTARRRSTCRACDERRGVRLGRRLPRRRGGLHRGAGRAGRDLQRAGPLRARAGEREVGRAADPRLEHERAGALGVAGR